MMVRACVLVAMVVATSAAPRRLVLRGTAAPDTVHTFRGRFVPRNPPRLRALQLLERRVPGSSPRVRFEWDQVTGATEYLLSGQWTSGPSWAMQSREFRVTQRVATSWQPDRVSFDISLPEGSHSWRLVALFGPRDVGDFESPTPVSFDVR